MSASSSTTIPYHYGLDATNSNITKSLTGDKFHTVHTTAMLLKMRDEDHLLPTVSSTDRSLYWDDFNITTLLGPNTHYLFESVSDDPDVASLFSSKPPQADAIFITDDDHVIAEFKNGVCDISTRHRPSDQHCVEMVLRNDTARLLVAVALKHREAIQDLFQNDPVTDEEVSTALDHYEGFQAKFPIIREFLATVLDRFEAKQRPLIFCQVWKEGPFGTDIFALTDVAVGRLLIEMTADLPLGSKPSRFDRALLQVFLMLRSGIKTGQMNELAIHKMNFGCHSKNDKIGSINGQRLHKIIGSHPVFYAPRFSSKFARSLHHEVSRAADYVVTLAQHVEYRKILDGLDRGTDDEIEDAIAHGVVADFVGSRASCKPASTSPLAYDAVHRGQIDMRLWFDGVERPDVVAHLMGNGRFTGFLVEPYAATIAGDRFEHTDAKGFDLRSKDDARQHIEVKSFTKHGAKLGPSTFYGAGRKPSPDLFRSDIAPSKDFIVVDQTKLAESGQVELVLKRGSDIALIGHAVPHGQRSALFG
jgi:hypothetical protein